MHIILHLSFLAVVVISITDATCTKPNKNKARVWKAQARHVKSVIENLEKAENNKDIFTGFGNFLKKITKNGTQCTSDTITDAIKTLTDCPTTAKASCEKDGLDFVALKIKAYLCFSKVTCSDLPDRCNLKSTLVELRKLRDENCINKDVPGSFKACINLLKGDLFSLISACVEVDDYMKRKIKSLKIY